MLKLRKTIFPLALLTMAAACGDDEPNNTDAGIPMDMGPADTGSTDMGTPAGNIVEVAQAAGLSDLLSAAMTAGLADTLSTGGPFTVFAPTNAAFAALGDNAPTDPGLLANVLLNHVVAGRLSSTDILSSTSATSLANTTLAIDTSASPVTVSGAALSTTLDVEASNGVVHVVDDVILPPTIPQAVGALDALSTLATAVGAASQPVQDSLGGAGPITVFAPVNSAFSGIDLSMLTQAQVDAILSYHVVSGQALSTDLSDGQVLTTANGASLTVNVTSGGEVSLTDAAGETINVVSTDIRLLNGTVHLIDGVLDPQSPVEDNIVQVAQRAGLNALITAATSAGLADTLANGGPFTVFAPTDSALQGVTLPSDSGLLANVLLNHVVPGRQMSTEVLAASSLTTAANTSIAVDNSTQPPTVGDAPLSNLIDQPASNGVVHILDGVIVPPNIAEAAAALPDLSTLSTAVSAADPAVAATLSGSGPITVFAPVNTAFQGVDVPALVADQPRLTDILQYHVATGQVLSGDLTNGQTITMANGATLVVNVDGAGNVSLQDGLGQTVNVVQADVRLLNGTVHLVDGVLNPGNLYEQANAANLQTLVSAIDRVGLAGALRGSTALTLFGPNDRAFGAVMADLSAVDDDVIANILVHHVVPGALVSNAVLSMPSLQTLGNLSLVVDGAATPPTVGGAPLTSNLDNQASNGILHEIDGVLVPPTTVTVASSVPDLSTVVQALMAASPATLSAVDPDTLNGDAPVTVFAPLDNAFTTQSIDVPTTPQAVLDAVLSYHVVSGQVLTSDLMMGPQTVTTLNGETLTITRSAGGTITITDATGGSGTVDVSLRDIRTLSGVVHVIDRVLQPQ